MPNSEETKVHRLQPSGSSAGVRTVNELILGNDNNAAAWKKWSMKFSLYLIAANCEDESDKRKVALLLHSIGDRGMEIFSSFSLDPDNVTYKEVTHKFDDYFIPKKNVTLERYKFFTRTQGPSETFDNFLTDLLNKSINCEFGPMKDELVRDIIIVGIKDNNLKERLLRESEISLETTISICKATELSHRQVREMTTDSTDAETVLNIKRQGRTTRKCFKCGAPWAPSHQCRATTAAKTCYTCGASWDPSHECPAKGTICKICGKENHYARVCRFKIKHVAPIQNKEDNDDDNEEFFIGSVAGESTNEWTEKLCINNTEIQVKIDTGAQVNCMSLYSFKCLKLNTKFIERSTTKLMSVDNSRILVYGRCVIKCYLANGQTENIEFYVIKSKCMPILGLKTCIKLKLITRNSIAKVCTLQNDDLYKMIEEHKNIFMGIGCFSKPYVIKLQDNAVPKADPPRRVPIALRESLQKELDNMVQQGIIEKIEEPAEWVNSMVITKKKNNKLRICIDPRYLNRFIMKQHKQLPTIDDIVDNLSGSKYFTKLDCSSGFWTVPLDSASSKLCTFSTPYGNYRYKRLPFGLCISTEAFQERMEEAFKDLEGVKFYVDDLIIYAKSVEEHNEILLNVLKTAEIHNVRFNKEKSEFLKTELKYLGVIVGGTGIKPDPEKVKAVTDIKSIKDKKDLERFLGVTNYLSKFIPDYSTLTAPLRDLLRKDCIFQWELPQESAFIRLKDALVNSPILQIYNVNKDIVMSVDCSSEGVGACLLQEGKPVAYASKALTDCQKEYAQVEREMYAIVFGCVKFHKYILGKRVTVESDHSALETLFKKPLHKVPSRIQRMMLKIQGYDLNVKYVPGKKMLIPDYLSRSYLPLSNSPSETKFDAELNTEIICHVTVTVNHLPISDEKKELIKLKTLEDPVLCKVKEYIQNGWPISKQNLDSSVTPFWNLRHDLSILNNMIFKNQLIVIPVSLQKMMLSLIHEGHFGYSTCWRRAKMIFFWPGLQAQIRDMCNSCQVCATFRPNNCKEPIIFHDVPKLPWIKLGSDLFEFNKCHYVLVVDYYSKYIEVARLEDLSSQCVIRHLKDILARHGVPLELVSDNGPQYSSEVFRKFSECYGFKHTTSSPNYPKANGLAESSVKIIKNVLKKAYYAKTDPYLALLNQRNLPKDGNPSPANLLFNRNLNDRCPVSKSYLQPKIYKRNENVDSEKQRKVKAYYDQNARNLDDLFPGQNIMFKKNAEDKMWSPGKVESKTSYPRSYNITTEDGRTYRRNRQHISTGSPQYNSDDDYISCDNEEMDPENTALRSMDNYVTRSGRIVRPPTRFLE